MTPHMSFDDLERGCSRGDCRWLSATMFSGQVVEGFRILGRCTLLGRDAYEDDCKACPHREARP